MQETKPKSFIKQFVTEQSKNPAFAEAYKVYKQEIGKQLGIKSDVNDLK